MPASSPLSVPETQGSPSAGSAASGGTPEAQPSAPELLPETNQLPPPPPGPEQPKGPPPAAPLPYDLIPQGGPTLLPGPQKPSAAQLLHDRVRFRQLKSLAQNDPFAIRLRWEAARSGTLEGRREYLRAYYQFTSAKMRKIEPRLKPIIDAYEAGQIAGLKQVNIKPTIPLRDLERPVRGAESSSEDQRPPRSVPE
jgi:hypothetical protein